MTKEYIEREALIKKIFPIGLIDDGRYAIPAKAVKTAIDNTPAADVVEVVRCNDCKFSKSDTPYCQENGEIYCEFDNLIKFKNHFCSFGERKEV